jgi:hypothetical protein
MGYPGYLYQHLQTLNIAIPTSSVMSIYNNCIHCMISFDQIGQLQESNIHIPQFWSTIDPQFSTIWCLKHQVLISLVFPNMRPLPRETTNKVDWNGWNHLVKPCLLVPLDSGRKSEGQPRSQSVCRRLLGSPQGNPSLIGSDDLWLGKKMDLWRIYPTRL